MLLWLGEGRWWGGGAAATLQLLWSGEGRASAAGSVGGGISTGLGTEERAV